jgi:hypothetical protein
MPGIRVATASAWRDRCHWPSDIFKEGSNDKSVQRALSAAFKVSGLIQINPSFVAINYFCLIVICNG